MTVDLTVLRGLLLVCFTAAYITGALFYLVFKPHISSWSVGYWTAVGILIGLVPMVLSLVSGVM